MCHKFSVKLFKGPGQSLLGVSADCCEGGDVELLLDLQLWGRRGEAAEEFEDSEMPLLVCIVVP